VEKLVVGVPACNEGATIAGLADALEFGSARLGERVRCELVLAYQAGGDDTLLRWQSRRFRLANRVLYCPPGLTGKGRNVKLLIRHARESGAHLLLVDADLSSYPPSHVDDFARAERLARGGAVLPLWCRPRGEGNSTDFLASPLLFAAYGAKVRQPLAGQMLLTSSVLETIDVDGLPDDYGIDIALTMHVLDNGLPIDQVVVAFPGHEGGANSHRIMANVASAMLSVLASSSGGATVRRPRRDVSWPLAWWREQSEPPLSTRSLRPLIDALVPSEQMSRWAALFEASPDVVRDMWCERLGAAVGRARAGHPIPDVVADLALPFLVHAEYRRQVAPDIDSAEIYLADLGDRLAATI
jgi:hypothetical protein